MAVGLGVAMACGGSSGATRDAANGADGAGGDARGGIDAATTFLVHGVATTTFLADAGMTVVPIDLATAEVSAISLDVSSGSTVRLTGAGSSDGTFVVPIESGDSSWFVGLGNGVQTTYLAGAIDHPDFGSVTLGRSDAQPASAGTTVALTATGLQPWGASDDLELLSSNAGAIEFSPQLHFATPPRGGDTAITAQLFPWSGNLVDAGAGDTVIAWQLATATSGSASYAGLASAGTVTDFTQASGSTASLSVALAPVPQEALALTWQVGAFEALRASAGSGAVDALSNILVIDALPDLAETASAVAAPDLVEMQVPADRGNLAATVRYGNPFATAGSAWDEFVFVKYKFEVPLFAPGTTTPGNLIAGGAEQLPVASLVDGAIAPVVTGVQDLTIDGQDASVPRTGIGAEPTLAWTAPTTGADVYGVEIFRVTALGAGTFVRETDTFFTHATSLQIPDGELTTGTAYAFKILSLKAAADPTIAPEKIGPLALFEVVSAVMQP